MWSITGSFYDHILFTAHARVTIFSITSGIKRDPASCQRRRLGELYAAFRAANGDNVLATHCRQRGGRERIVLAAFDAEERPLAPCNLSPVNRKTSPIERMSPNYWFTKMSAARIARALMSELERIARQERKTVLVLDTATGSGAEQFYARCGWEKWKFRAMR